MTINIVDWHAIFISYKLTAKGIEQKQIFQRVCLCLIKIIGKEKNEKSKK